MPSGFIMGDIKDVVLHQDIDVSEFGCITNSDESLLVISKNWK